MESLFKCLVGIEEETNYRSLSYLSNLEEEGEKSRRSSCIGAYKGKDREAVIATTDSA